MAWEVAAHCAWIGQELRSKQAGCGGIKTRTESHWTTHYLRAGGFPGPTRYWKSYHPPFTSPHPPGYTLTRPGNIRSLCLVPLKTLTLYAVRLYLVILAVCAYGLRSYGSYRRLAHVKGPLLASWSNFWLVRNVYNLDTHQKLYEVNKKYGVLFLLIMTEF